MISFLLCFSSLFHQDLGSGGKRNGFRRPWSWLQSLCVALGFPLAGKLRAPLGRFGERRVQPWSRAPERAAQDHTAMGTGAQPGRGPELPSGHRRTAVRPGESRVQAPGRALWGSGSVQGHRLSKTQGLASHTEMQTRLQRAEGREVLPASPLSLRSPQ